MGVLYGFKNVIIDLDSGVVICGNKTYKMSFTDAKTLEILISHPYEVITKDEIKSYAWSGRVVSDTSITKAISNLRNIFSLCGLSSDLITTVARVGYKLVESPTINPNTSEPKIKSAYESNDEPSSSDSFSLLKAERVSDTSPSLSTRMNFFSTQLRCLLSMLKVSIYSKTGRNLMISSAAVFLFISVINITYLFPLDIHKEFIAKGYENRLEEINNKKIHVILRTNAKTPYAILSKIEKISSGSTVYFDVNGRAITLSYYDKKSGDYGSYVFSARDISSVAKSINMSIEREGQM